MNLETIRKRLETYGEYERGESRSAALEELLSYIRRLLPVAEAAKRCYERQTDYQALAALKEIRESLAPFETGIEITRSKFYDAAEKAIDAWGRSTPGRPDPSFVILLARKLGLEGT